MGFHFFVIDMEHGAADVSQSETLFALAERYGAAPMVRIPSLDGDLARRLMDLGAHGIIVSTVESAESFAEFAKSCFYPPEGKRGVGISRCNQFGDRFKEYLMGFKPVLMAMVETSGGFTRLILLHYPAWMAYFVPMICLLALMSGRFLPPAIYKRR